MDQDGPWSWRRSPFWKDVHPRLAALENMTWAEIPETGSHAIASKDMPHPAQKRLEELQLDDVDEIWSLRVSSRQRIWGIRDGRSLKLLWWDPNHKVFPSPKKHT